MSDRIPGLQSIRVGRTTPKQNHVIEALRASILTGALPAGGRIPSRKSLQERFAVASVTMQLAIDRLVADGFLEARGNQGTFVVAHIPSANHYALVSPFAATQPRRQFWRALVNEAKVVSRTSQRRISVYYRVDGTPEAADHQRLLRDLRHQRLAGIIFAVNPFLLDETPLLTIPHVPRIAIMSGPRKHVAAAVLDDANWITKALDHFASRRRTHVAVLSVPGTEGIFRKRVLAGLAARGLMTKPYWWHTIDQSHAEGTQAITHLLLNSGQRERPDALLVTDDNLVEHATAGLVAAGALVPRDVEVIVHSNFPWLTPAALPVRRLGYDAREVLSNCLEWIDSTRSGTETGQNVLIPARFEDELALR